jgi:hypothetical protein
MTVPSFPPDTYIVKDSIRESIQRAITVNVKVAGTPCPTCDLDPITNTSLDSFCETCSGVYWLNTTSGWLVSGHVRWMGADQPYYTPGGVIDTGDCLVTIKYTVSGLAHVQNSDSFIVDGRDMYLKKYILRGVPTVDRIRIILKEDSE